MKKQNKSEYRLTNYQIATIIMNSLLFIISIAMICSKTIVDNLDYVFWLCLALTSFIIVCDILRKNNKKKKQFVDTPKKLSKRPNIRKKESSKKVVKVKTKKDS